MGIRRLKALGAHVAQVNSYNDNTAANALYQSVGFREQDRVYAWLKGV
jgi:ribosomal protein S18 acetylase RimI-like enzyme